MNLLAALLAFVILGAAQPAPQATPSAASPVPRLYVIHYRPGPAFVVGRPLLQQNLREHSRYMHDMAARGIILVAGPSFSDNGGFVVVATASIDEARALMLADPAVQTGIFVGEISDWRPGVDPGGRFRAAPSQP